MEVEKIKLSIRPGAAENSVEGFFGDRIKIRVKARPEKGKANKELISFISEKTGISKKDIEIISGKTSNLKEIRVIKNSSASICSMLIACCNAVPDALVPDKSLKR